MGTVVGTIGQIANRGYPPTTEHTVRDSNETTRTLDFYQGLINSTWSTMEVVPYANLSKCYLGDQIYPLTPNPFQVLDLALKDLQIF